MSKDDPVVIEAGDYAQLVEDYLDACDRLDDMTAHKDELREQLLPLIKDADVVSLDGRPALRHSFSPGSELVDVHWLKKNWPDIHAASLRLSKPSHRITVIHEKGNLK
jgi:hypothetical protein